MAEARLVQASVALTVAVKGITEKYNLSDNEVFEVMDVVDEFIHLIVSGCRMFGPKEFEGMLNSAGNVVEEAEGILRGE